MLLPEIIDHRATASPKRIFGYSPKSNHLEDGFVPLTYSGLAKAVNAMALWLDEELGTVHEYWTQTVPYIGASDIRYILLLHACIKSGRCFMTPLTFNSTDGLVKLLGTCKTVLTCQGHHHHWKGVKEKISDLAMIELPSVEAFVHNDSVADYPCGPRYAESIGVAAYKVQSSGTTGMPKMIDIILKEIHNGYDTDGVELCWHELFGKGCHVPSLLPMSWMAGLWFTACSSLTMGLLPILLPAAAPQPMTPEYVVKVMQLAPKGEKNGLIWIPSGLRQLVKDPTSLEGLKRYDSVGYTGAPLDHDTGDLIAKYTRVQSLVGDTSLGLCPLILSDPADWKIHRISPHLGHFFEHYTEDLYELCVRRQPDDSRVCFTREPTLKVFRTRDLWRKVKGRPGFWETAGRMDDFVKLSSMTKFNAIVVEQRLESHPGVVRALVAGDARSRPFAIVELDAAYVHDEKSSREALVEAIEIANKDVFQEIQLDADLVIIADAARSIKRTDKGSTDRRGTIIMYAQEIDEGYRKIGLAE